MTEASDNRVSPDLSVQIGRVRLKNPVMTASGTCGYGLEYAPLVDLSRLGAFTTKSVTLEPRPGNPPERIVETAGGMLNAIGLANVGLERFIAEKVPELAKLGTAVFVNVAGHSIDEYVEVCGRIDELCETAISFQPSAFSRIPEAANQPDAPARESANQSDAPAREGDLPGAPGRIVGVELNVSCPNVADGLVFGTDAAKLRELVTAVRGVVRRGVLIVKLSPNVTDITAMARAAIEGGADALSLVNTFLGMAIDIRTRRPRLANRWGGLSGPAIKPLAVYLVNKVWREVARDAGVPIIGLGGITCWPDAVEFLLAGATAVSIGTALFVDPTTPLKIIEGLEGYLRERGLASVEELVGGVEGG